MKPLLVVLCAALSMLSSCLGQERLEPPPTYLLAAPRKVRPNQVVTMSATLLRLDYSYVNFRVLIKRDDTEICSVFETFDATGTKLLQMKMPENSVLANYTLRVEGTTSGGASGYIFENETALEFDSKQISLFIQLSKPLYRQGQIVRFRVIPVQTNLLPIHTDMDIYVYDGRGGLVRRWLNQQTNSGVLSKEIEIANFNSIGYGDWTIRVIAKGHEYFKTFTVEENYDPWFYVNVSTVPYIMTDSFGLSGIVSSNHSNGYVTKGNATITLTILDPNRPTEDTPPKIERVVPYFEGRTDFLFTRQEMEAEAGGNLAGKLLRVHAEVLDFFMVYRNDAWQTAKVYSSDIVLEWLGDHVRSFKPGMMFTAYLAASNQDRTPITTHRRTVTMTEIHRKINDGPTRTYEEKVYTLPLSGVLSLDITPELDDELIIMEARYEDISTRYRMQAYRQYSPTESYIQITSSTTDPVVNGYMVFTVSTNTYVEQIYYMIVAGGNIIITDTLMMSARHKTFSIALSRDMVPSARIIVYFVHVTTAEVISDTMNFYIKANTLNNVKVKVNRGKDFSGNTMEIQATSDQLSYVCLSAVEYSHYTMGINNALTEDMTVDELFTYDEHANSTFKHTWWLPEHKQKRVHYPSPTYAPDANKTFAFAGLHVFTDSKLVEVQHDCNFTLGWLPCWDGSCYRNHTRCNGFMDCKRDGADEFGCETNATKMDKLDRILWDSKHTAYHFLDYDWMWKESFTKPDGRIDIKVDVPYHPGSWIINAFSMSKSKGLGFLENPARYDGSREFYMTVEHAENVRWGEQVGFRVTLFNFWDGEIEVLTWLHRSEDYKFVIVDYGGQVNSYAPREGTGDMQTLVVVKPGTSRYIFFPVLPKKMGHVDVTISAMCFVGAETVTKSLYVQPNGVTNYFHTPYLLDLLNTGSLILPEFNISIPAEFIEPETSWHLYVPGSQKVTISAVGDVIGPGMFEEYITSQEILREPYACGEQTLFNFGYMLYSLKFLKDTNQLSNELRDKTLVSLNMALQEVYAFYREAEDGSGYLLVFEDWSPPSVWVTALAVGTLHDGYVSEWINELFIDVTALDKLALWLVAQQNTEEGPMKGSFKETAPTYDRNMRSNYTTVNGVNVKDNLALTAHVLISFSKLTKITSANDTRSKVDTAKKLAQEYLGTKVDQIKDPYTMAIVTYALTITKSVKSSSAYQMLKNMKIEREYDYWSPVEIKPNPSATVNTIEYLDARIPQDFESAAVGATSYALLCYLLNSEREEGSLSMKWLQTMRNTVGGFSGTADSLAALHALTAYAQSDTDRSSYNMKITVSARDYSQTLDFTSANYPILQRVDLPVTYGSVKVSAQGSGLALLQMESQVNVEYAFLLRQPPVKSYTIDVTITPGGRNMSIMDYHACVSWTRLQLSPRSGMSVLEIEMASGYIVWSQYLNNLMGGKMFHERIKKAEFNGKTVNFYFDYLDGNVTCVDFRAYRWYPAANYTREYLLRVYDYYETSNHNTSLFWLEGLNRLDICQVCGSWQCPYCPFYNTAPSGVNYSILLMVAAVIFASLQLNWIQVLGIDFNNEKSVLS